MLANEVVTFHLKANSGNTHFVAMTPVLLKHRNPKFPFEHFFSPYYFQEFLLLFFLLRFAIDDCFFEVLLLGEGVIAAVVSQALRMRFSHFSRR